MDDLSLVAKLLLEAAPHLSVMLAVVWALYKLGKRALELHYEHLTKNVLPLYERGVAAIERLSNTAAIFTHRVEQKLDMIDASQEGLWEEWKAKRKEEHRDPSRA